MKINIKRNRERRRIIQMNRMRNIMIRKRRLIHRNIQIKTTKNIRLDINIQMQT